MSTIEHKNGQAVVTLGNGHVTIEAIYTPQGERAIYLTQCDPGKVGDSADHVPPARPDVVLDYSEAQIGDACGALDVLIEAAQRLKNKLIEDRLSRLDYQVNHMGHERWLP